MTPEFLPALADPALAGGLADPVLAAVDAVDPATAAADSADPVLAAVQEGTTTANETTTTTNETTAPAGPGPEDGSARFLPTLGVVGLAAVAIVLAQYAGRRLRQGDRFDDDLVATAEAAATTGLILAAAGVVLYLWHDVTPVERALDQFRPDPLFGIQVVVSLLTVAAAYGLTRVTGRLLKRRDPGDDQTPPSVDHRREVAFYVTEVAIYVAAGLLVLSFWRVNLGNLLIGAGFLGIVVGLAARQTLGAVIAGFVLLFARNFKVGEWVVIGDREGVVTDVNVVHTRLRTFDGEQVVIPNDRVANQDVINRSREGRLRVTQEVGVDYGTEVGRAVEVARAAIEDCDVDPLLSAPGPQVVAKRFDDSSVVLELRFWISSPTARRMWRTRTAVTEAVKAAFEREGIAIPFPQRTVSGRENAPVGVRESSAGDGIPPSVDPGDAARVSVAPGSGDDGGSGASGETGTSGSGDSGRADGSDGTDDAGSADSDGADDSDGSDDDGSDRAEGDGGGT